MQDTNDIIEEEEEKYPQDTKSPSLLDNYNDEKNTNIDIPINFTSFDHDNSPNKVKLLLDIL